VVRDGELFVVEAGRRRLVAISLATGVSRVYAESLAVGVLRDDLALFCHGMPGAPRPFAGLAVGPDGTLYVSVDGRVLSVR
jgi:hypothetical protein